MDKQDIQRIKSLILVMLICCMPVFCGCNDEDENHSIPQLEIAEEFLFINKSANPNSQIDSVLVSSGLKGLAAGMPYTIYKSQILSESLSFHLKTTVSIRS